QLAHAGRKASSYRPWEGALGLKNDDDPWETIAPSAIAFGNAWQAPRAMTRDDMDRVRAAFVSSAQRAARLGLDAIETSLAHGTWLFAALVHVADLESSQRRVRRLRRGATALSARSRAGSACGRAAFATARGAHHRKRLD